MSHSYHVYADYRDYDIPSMRRQIDKVVEVEKKILTSDDYIELKKYLLEREYHRRIPTEDMRIFSLSYLGSSEE